MPAPSRPITLMGAEFAGVRAMRLPPPAPASIRPASLPMPAHTTPGASANPLIVGCQDPRRAEDAAAVAVLLGRATAAPVILADVAPPGGGGALDHRWQARLRADVTRRLAAGPERVRLERGRPATATATAPAAGRLHGLAAGERARAIILGACAPAALAARDMVATLTEGAPCPVCVAPVGYGGRYAPRLEHIGVAFDGSPGSRTALVEAAHLARLVGAGLEVLAVVPETHATPWAGTAPAALLEEALADAVERLGGEVQSRLRMIPGDPARDLAPLADPWLDLLLVGSAASGRPDRVALGGVSRALLEASPAPVLVVPAGAAGIFAPTA
jgi:nucleotide-binding universal stress UspA family protein